ncbi:MAG: hypothetical protein SV686_09780 [Thermodesulfobacteriota bacterium]|nr:hypothetical protein [Thermodesulfobacteriota bacterium]
MNRMSGITPDLLKAALIACLLTAFSFSVQGNIGLNLADEGRLWYNTTRTAVGEIPRLDFRSYDPARLYWTAAWSFLLGDGIMSLRLSIAVFQALGLIFGLMVLKRIIPSWRGLFLVGILLLIWMFPRHKLFEHSLAMAGVYFAVFLIEKPNIGRHFTVGIFVGLAAFFGRNHGFYNFLSFSLLLSFIWYRTGGDDLTRRAIAWAGGIAVGYAPMVVMFFLIPGLFDKFFSNILSIIHRGSTNLPLPVPWPWSANLQGMDLASIFEHVSTGMIFLILPLYYLFSGAIIYKQFRSEDLLRYAPFVASVFVGATYMHHAFARPDISHLAQGIHPFLIGVISLPFLCSQSCSKIMTFGLLVAVGALSLFSAVTASPYYLKLTSSKDAFVMTHISGDDLWVEKPIEEVITTAILINTQKMRAGEGLFIAPDWPGLYPILGRKSPTWDTYFLWKSSKDDQLQMISDLNSHNVNGVLLGDVAFDGRDDLRFENTHTLLWQYIMRHFEPVPTDGLPPNYQFLRRKGSANRGLI